MTRFSPIKHRTDLAERRKRGQMVKSHPLVPVTAISASVALMMVVMIYGPGLGLGLGTAAGSVGVDTASAGAVAAPNQPTLDVMVFAATNDSARLLGSVFAGSGADTHDSTQFTVVLNSGTFGTADVLASALGAVETDTVPGLTPDSVYKARTRYKGASGGWSAWSDSAAFTASVTYRSNLPAGLTLIDEQDFSTAAPTGNGAWEGIWTAENTIDPTYDLEFRDGTGGFGESPDAALQVFFADSSVSGGGPRVKAAFAAQTKLYVSCIMKFSPLWSFNWVSTKLLVGGASGGNQLFLTGFQNPGGEISAPDSAVVLIGEDPYYGARAGDSVNVNPVVPLTPVLRDSIYEFEFYSVAATEKGELWINGVAQQDTAWTGSSIENYTNLQFTPQGSGSGTPVPDSMWVEVDHCWIYGEPA